MTLQLDSLEARRVKCDLICCYKIIHGLVDLNSADFFQVCHYFYPGMLRSRDQRNLETTFLVSVSVSVSQ